MHITEDLILGARYRYTKHGPTLLRVFDVSGLVPGRDTLAQASGAVDSAGGAHVPRYGEPHPSVANLYAIEVDVQPAHAASTAARVVVRYGSPEFAAVPGAVRVRITGSSGHKLVSRLPSGDLITVKYTDPAGNVLQDHLQIPVLSPNTVLEFTRQENASPLRLSSRFRRTVNASPWQGGDARTWLCRAVDGTSVAGLARYEVRYVFEYDPDGWERLEYFVDRFTGKVPDDVKISPNNDKGVAKILPYAVMDYGQLGLPNAY